MLVYRGRIFGYDILSPLPLCHLLSSYTKQLARVQLNANGLVTWNGHLCQPDFQHYLPTAGSCLLNSSNLLALVHRSPSIPFGAGATLFPTSCTQSQSRHLNYPSPPCWFASTQTPSACSHLIKVLALGGTQGRRVSVRSHASYLPFPPKPRNYRTYFHAILLCRNSQWVITLWNFLNFTDRQRTANEGTNEISTDIYQNEKGSYSSDSTPSLGTSICYGCGPKIKKKKKETKINLTVISNLLLEKQRKRNPHSLLVKNVNWHWLWKASW